MVIMATSILSTDKVLKAIPLQRLKRSTLFVDVLSVKEFPRALFLNVRVLMTLVFALVKLSEHLFLILIETSSRIRHSVYSPDVWPREWEGLLVWPSLCF